MTFTSLTAFALICLGMVLTPGPNMIYLVSRAISQSRAAAFVSLCGVALGLLCYVICAALGITALMLAVPFAYEALKFAGALYLLWLAWQTLKPGGRSAFDVRNLDPDRPRKLFLMGYLTSLLNPKIAMLYVSLLPQFINPAAGSVLLQSITLGMIQICVSVTVNSLIICFAALIANLMRSRPRVALAQRWVSGFILGAFAVKMALEERR